MFWHALIYYVIGDILACMVIFWHDEVYFADVVYFGMHGYMCWYGEVYFGMHVFDRFID